jgi:hypothetical protein
METASPKIIPTIHQVNISLSPNNLYRKPFQGLPRIKRIQKEKIKSSKILKPEKDTYSIGYIGDTLGELRISFKRSSIPKISPIQVSRSVRRESPTAISHNEYSVHKYFKPKPLTPASLKLFDFIEYRNRLAGNHCSRYYDIQRAVASREHTFII